MSLTMVAAILSSCAPQNELSSVMGGGYLFRPQRIKIDPDKAVSYGYWDVPEGLTGQHLIVIDTQLQQAKYYIGGKQVGLSTISSGKDGHLTPKGTFPVLAKDADHISSSYGSIVDAQGNTLIGDYTQGQPIPPGGRYKGAPMPNALQLTTGGIWLHEGLVTAAPESHGCIRLPKEMAKIFFDNTPVGTPVIVR